MGDSRKAAVAKYLRETEPKGSLLDVGTGRGETLDLAESLGFAPVIGTEVVPDLIDGARVVHGEVHALPFPDGSYDHVTMFDVMEHLLPGDDELAVRELCRVARDSVLLTIANFPSVKDGEVLHINLRPYREWDGLLREWAAGMVVDWLPNHGSISECWRLSHADPRV
jgi:ubiquinone/menaquinone biosynthesis C-methylase UbiE